MDTLTELKPVFDELKQHAKVTKPRFFKTGPGDYAEHDKFIGISVPLLRKIARHHGDLSFQALQQLITSPINEERLLALLIIVARYQRGNATSKEQCYQFYLKNLTFVNNWNLVDASAHLIMGAHLWNSDKSILLHMAQSNIMWERRIAMVSTWYFIRHHEFDYTLKIADILLNDTHDLIHKSVGWMLRELGKKDPLLLTSFLDKQAHLMPRTMLRYAIEKLSADERRFYLNK